MFDGILFGNGMTINLLEQLKDNIPHKKQYLLKMDTFLIAFYSNLLSPREERIMYKIMYRKINPVNDRFFRNVKELIKDYYLEYDSNIELIMGSRLFEKEQEYKDYASIKSLFPILYNIWFVILREYLSYEGLDGYIVNYYKSVASVVSSRQNIWTTNFDFLSESINSKHLHGKFVKNMNNTSDVVFRYLDDEKRNFYYKYIWGWNGIGKISQIKEFEKYPDYCKYFDFDFFNTIYKMDELLVYGLSFQASGYMKDLGKVNDKYKDPTPGGVIDEHILMRISGLQEIGALQQAVFTYYNKNEKEYFNKLMKVFMIKKYKLIQSQELNFSIQ